MGIVGLIATAAFAEDASKACSSSEHRQLDYWLGSWSVNNGASTGTSKVELSLDQCMVVETWNGARNHMGKNMFAYNPDDHRWYGMFADNEGRVHIFTDGKVEAGTAEFRGTSRGENGELALNRIRVMRVSADKVEQTWEKSSDNGTTWNVVYRGVYSKRNP